MRIEARLIPNASRDEITDCSYDGYIKVKVQSPPVDGAANKRLIRFLAKTAGVSKSKVRIISGEKSRIKIIEIDGDEAEIMQRIKDAK